MDASADIDPTNGDTRPEDKKDDQEDDESPEKILFSSADTPQQLMVASRLIKLAQRLPSRQRTTAEQDAARLEELTRQAHNCLFESKPITLFAMNADTISIDRQKVTVSHRSLFRVVQTVSIQIVDIINVQANLGVMYGTLTITSKHFLNNVQTARYLRRKDVISARRLLQGMMIACQAKIDFSKIETKKLLPTLYDLGRENRATG